MRSVAAMEWLLARFAGKRQAAAMMGDLLEQREQRGAWWFWRAAAGVMLAVAWRPVLGFVGAFYVCNWSQSALQMRTFGIHAEHHPEVLWTPTLMTASVVGSTMWFMFVYAGIRYGLRDHVTRLSLGIAALATTLIFGWWQPLVLALCAIACIGLIATAAISRGYRRASLVVTAVELSGIIALLAFTSLGSLYQSHVYSGPIGDREWRAHPSIVWVWFAVWPLTTFAMASTCAWIHERLMGGDSRTVIAD